MFPLKEALTEHPMIALSSIFHGELYHYVTALKEIFDFFIARSIFYFTTRTPKGVFTKEDTTFGVHSAKKNSILH